jgi:hypothetical protein
MALNYIMLLLEAELVRQWFTMEQFRLNNIDVAGHGPKGQLFRQLEDFGQRLFELFEQLLVLFISRVFDNAIFGQSVDSWTTHALMAAFSHPRLDRHRDKTRHDRLLPKLLLNFRVSPDLKWHLIDFNHRFRF